MVEAVTYEDLFLNISPPQPDTEEYEERIDKEINRITKGITIDGVFITPWLYWHTNHWHLGIDQEDDSKEYLHPVLRDNEWIRGKFLQSCLEEKLGYFEVGTRQSGKALLNSSLLYTPTGEITIGDCNIGDKIFDESGNTTTIIAKYPQGIRPVYKVILVDGREIFCDEDHKWFVKDRRTKSKVKEKVLTTKELSVNYRHFRKDWGHRKNPYEFRYQLPQSKCVNYTTKEQLLDPYFLGLWLGDGSNSYSKITSIDKEIIDYLYQYAKSVDLQVTVDDVDTFMITSGEMGGSKTEMKNKNFIHTYLKEHLYNNKHIPHNYMFGNKEQRLELLRGLMDSDGSVYKNGTIDFSSSIPQLAEDFYKLCRSLGISLTRSTKKASYVDKNGVKKFTKDSTKFYLHTEEVIFKLTRKKERVHHIPKYKDWVGISNIEYVKDAETTCIVVDNDSHLFLTDNFTVTHNSELEASFSALSSILKKNTQNLIVGNNATDINLITAKIDAGLIRLWEGINIPRLDKTWRGSAIRLGFKTTAGEDRVWSTIMIRNTDGGNNTEVAAGTTASSFIMDEVAKELFLAALAAAKPAIKGRFGYRAIPMLVACLTAGNKVFTKEGNLVNIEDLQYTDGIIGFDKDKQTTSLEEITNINPPQEKECYSIVTNKGTKIECSYDHPILIKHRDHYVQLNNKKKRKLEFVETKNLKVGMTLSLPDIIPLLGTKIMENPYFIGAIIGDGNYSADRGIRFYNEDIEIWDYLDSIGKDYTVFKSHITEKGRIYKEARFRGGMKQLKEIGIYGQSGDSKDLPKDIHLYQESDVRELIAGLFDTDGCVMAKGKNNYIFMSSSCEKLIDSLKMLLLRLGIHSNKSFKPPFKGYKEIRGKQVVNNKGHFELSVADRESILVFCDKIPLKIKRKNDNIEKLKLFFSDKKSQIDSNYKGMRFEKIISIEHTGMKPVYNLTTSNTHTYLANGIITHNTGGNADKSGDAETLYFNPGSYDFKSVIHEDGTETCLFLSGVYRQEFKYETNLYDYLISTGEITPETVLNNGENLKKIVMWVSNVEKATETILEERKKLKASADSLSYLKAIMYSPLHVHECFLSEKSGLFNQDAARRQRLRLIEQGRIGTYVELYEEEGEVKHRFTDKLPIYNYPIQKNESKDAPVVIYEFPVDDAPHGLHVAGVDSYRMALSESSNSLGSVYIFKRMHSLMGEKYQDMLVASYVARPEDKEHWNDQALLLIQYYNAKALVENDEISFIDYVISKNKSQYLEYQPEWLKAIDANSRVKRPFGISRSNEKVRDHLHGLVNRYMNEVMNIQKDENGVEISRTTGEIRILDIPLLQEIEKCDGKINVDRVIAFELALAMAYNLNPIYEDSIGKQRGSIDHTIKRTPLFARTGSVFPKNKLRF